MNPGDLLLPEWDAPARVRALCSTRRGGVSRPPYDSLNLGAHVGDDAQAVARNRARLAAGLPAEPAWLEQVHGVEVLDLDLRRPGDPAVPRADAALSRHPGQVCAVMTADCLPVLFCDDAGSVVAAAHAGWRGLCGGVLERTVACMGVPPSTVQAWLGPAIGPSAFEVGDEVRAAFLQHDAQAAAAFVPSANAGRWLADLYLLARQRLRAAGVLRTAGGTHCTYGDAARFFSYRRDGATGRMAALIWLADEARPQR